LDDGRLSPLATVTMTTIIDLNHNQLALSYTRSISFGVREGYEVLFECSAAKRVPRSLTRSITEGHAP